jgi:hypothetical protein
MTPEEAQQEWLKAQSFNDLCELGAKFITRQLPYFPGYDGNFPDKETSEISDDLAKLNRKGFLTIQSQPAYLEEFDGQRACVEGFALEELALDFAKKTLYSDIHIQIFPLKDILPNGEYGYQIPVTVEEGQPFTWMGRCDKNVLWQFEIFSPIIVDIIEENPSVWYVSAIDLVWGRKDRLWDVLLSESLKGYSVKPHPNIEMDEGIAFYY